MKKLALSAAIVCCAATASQASNVTHWGYTGDSAPEHWGKLNPEYQACATGKNQSPIDLTGFVEAELEPIAFAYSGLAKEVINNGHSIQANYTSGSTLSIDGKTFELKQFHFHSPSENTLDGAFFPLEGHFVHVDGDGNIAVLAVLYALGEENPALAKLWKQMPEKAGEKAALASQVRAEDLMPEDKDYYRFNGSLTTPPCSEGVRWLVLKNQATVSQEQVGQFTHVMHEPNNRPVQPTNARLILQ